MIKHLKPPLKDRKSKDKAIKIKGPKPYSISEPKQSFMIAENIFYGGKEIITLPPLYVD